MKHFLFAILYLLLSLTAAQTVTAPWGCHLQIDRCLSKLAKTNFGYDSSIESIWQFMSRTTTGCETVLRPYLTNPPYLAVSQSKGDELIACLNTI